MHIDDLIQRAPNFILQYEKYFYKKDNMSFFLNGHMYIEG